MSKMSKEYIPTATANTTYYKPETQQEMEQMTVTMKLGDMLLTSGYFKPAAVCGIQWV